MELGIRIRRTDGGIRSMAAPTSRRSFIARIGAAGASSLAWPLPLGAQQPGSPTIGWLNALSPPTITRFIAAFHQGLLEAGYVEGKNVAIEYRWADGHYERLPAMAAELVQRQVAVLFAVSPACAQPAKPVESDASKADQARLVQQQRVTATYREMQQAAFEAKLAEQDVLNTQDAYNATRARADALKADLDKFTKTRDAAKAKEAAARKRYDDALNAVPR